MSHRRFNARAVRKWRKKAGAFAETYKRAVAIGIRRVVIGYAAIMGDWLVYTDGSAKPGGPGGWGFVLRPQGASSESPRESYGKAQNTIAKIMEYRAVAEALLALPAGASALVFSDNLALVENLGKKLDIWRQNGFKKVDLDIVADVRRIAETIEQKNLRLRWQWLKSHNGNAGNERADQLAAQGAREAKSESR
jgi:ribonuclease HI